MKKSLSLCILIAVSFPAMGKGTASPLTRILSRAPELLGESYAAGMSGRTLKDVSGEDMRYIPAIIRASSADAELPDFVYEYARRGDLVLISVPADRLGEVVSTQGVLRMESGICAAPTMDIARGVCNLPEVYSYNREEGPYSGKGVVVGFTDIGFDPNHITFAGADGSSRIRRLVDYRPFVAAPTRLLTPGEISQWTSDNVTYWHATHVGGILAGGFDGNAYRGVAPEATIVASTSGLHEPHLLAGIEEAVDYARSIGAPVPVMNMSVSSSLGPHDGTSLFNSYLERLSEDAMVCISAGNDGQKWGGSFTYNYSADKPRVQAFCREYPTNSPHKVAGSVDLWSNDDRPLTLRILVYDSDTRKVVHTFPSVDIDAGITDVTLTTADVSKDYYDEDFARLFESGYVAVSCEVNPENHRYNATMAFNVTNPGDLSNHWIGVEVEGKPGTGGDVYASSAINFMLLGDELSAACSNRQSINDLACGIGPAVVGSITSRNSSGEAVREPLVSDFSSFATLRDGRVLPTFCAPGGGIIASVSGQWVKNINAGDEHLIPAVVDGTTYYWKESSGTSMSAPYAAGVFALWLEANPSLTPADLLRIATETAMPAPTSDVRWGGGLLDAYAGLKAALAMGGIVAPSTDVPLEILTDGGNRIEVRAYTQPITSVEVYNTSGARVLSVAPGTSEWSVDLGSLAPGVYLVKAAATSCSKVRKVAVR